MPSSPISTRGSKVVIASTRAAHRRPNREEMYKWRHLIENFFGKLKEFKRIADGRQDDQVSPP